MRSLQTFLVYSNPLTWLGLLLLAALGLVVVAAVVFGFYALVGLCVVKFVFQTLIQRNRGREEHENKAARQEEAPDWVTEIPVRVGRPDQLFGVDLPKPRRVDYRQYYQPSANRVTSEDSVSSVPVPVVPEENAMEDVIVNKGGQPAIEGEAVVSVPIGTVRDVLEGKISVDQAHPHVSTAHVQVSIKDQLKARAFDLKRQGTPVRSIAKQLAVPESTVRGWCKKAGV